ncbi:MAG TPA: HAD domain-containing protein [Methanosarcina sp.]|nr:HAD domain-containing protein [Methanosarcina sp.]
MGFIYLFLDIDGVLNHSETKETYNGCIGIDPECLANLIEILFYFKDARIVISSSWRLTNSLFDIINILGETMNKLPQYSKHDGIEFFKTRVIGRTPPERESRGAEIAEWLEENAGVKIERWRSSKEAIFIAIDDSISDIMEYLNAYHIVQTRFMSPFKGLEFHHIKEVVKLVNFQESLAEKSYVL